MINKSINHYGALIMITVTAFGQTNRPTTSPETFKPIPDFTRYRVSDQGRIATASGAIMADYDSGKGYRQIVLIDDNGKARHMYVHRLVLMAHVGLPPSPTHQAAHWPNADRSDNRLENLRWATPRENAADKRRHAAERRAAITPTTLH
jgi:hypothetical protein